jgi:hypothetical protein
VCGVVVANIFVVVAVDVAAAVQLSLVVDGCVRVSPRGSVGVFLVAVRVAASARMRPSKRQLRARSSFYYALLRRCARRLALRAAAAASCQPRAHTVVLALAAAPLAGIGPGGRASHWLF